MAARDDHVRTLLAARIDVARTRLLDSLAQRTEELAALVETASGDDAAAQAARDALRMALHNLAGSAPTIGLAVVGARARDLEATLVAAPTGPLTAEFAQRLRRDLRALASVAS
ncbi:Hpt domain-containing protein [Hansschlegelia sp.]|uniref:Hpt domain-containing protein n=1 Tax=Hansschlegelia sp. TaxID=2041892 RepID=UPI002B8F532E|nr:Hpt domain-containing protein [Hansschlegelia sp.]HVI27372.1 Hpt domain-containing protein [Hansschlegelia sp.]